jgi:UDP-N-acetylmuramyl pentapeptide phosphotransferase/UDP-N-acetylglucosamine-1-phosphate transferase
MEVLDPVRRSLTALAASPLMLKVLWLSLCAGIVSTSLTALLIKVATLRGWVVIPSQNRWNKRTVAQFGGGPVLLTFWGVVMLAPGSHQLAAVLLATVAMSLLGLIDDIKGLGPKPKLMVEVLSAFAVVYSGIVLPISAIPILNIGLTVLWIVTITNAFNIIDNMDGLAAGTAIIALSAIALLAGVNTPFGIASLLLMISLAGFFIFNLNPARIFMGDLGALPIGFFLACGAAVAGANVPRRGAAVAVPCMLLAMPLFDVLLVSITRRLKGRAISLGARDHSSHRLVFLGVTERSRNTAFFLSVIRITCLFLGNDPVQMGCTGACTLFNRSLTLVVSSGRNQASGELAVKSNRRSSSGTHAGPQQSGLDCFPRVCNFGICSLFCCHGSAGS